MVGGLIVASAALIRAGISTPLPAYGIYSGIIALSRTDQGMLAPSKIVLEHLVVFPFRNALRYASDNRRECLGRSSGLIMPSRPKHAPVRFFVARQFPLSVGFIVARYARARVLSSRVYNRPTIEIAFGVRRFGIHGASDTMEPNDRRRGRPVRGCSFPRIFLAARINWKG